MNILFCTTMFDRAMTGSGRFAQTLVRMAESIPNVNLHILSEDIDAPSVRKHLVLLSGKASMRFLGYWYKSQDYACAISKVLAMQQIDVILFNDAWLGYHWIKYFESPPVIVSVKDDNALHLWRNPPGGIPGLTVRRKMEHYSCHNAVGTITNSVYMASMLAAHYGVKEENIDVLPPVYTDYASIRSNCTPISQDSVIKVLFVKNDFRRGGLDLLIQAMTGLTQFQFVLTVVGPHAKQVRQRYDTVIAKQGHLQVRLYGREYNYAKVLQLMQEHHIFCVPSKREAFGVANIEALASGMRVVFYPVGGMPPELREFAFPMENRSITALQHSLLHAIHTETEEMQVRLTRARRWIEDTFTLDYVQSGLEKVFNKAYAHVLTGKPKERTA